MSKQPSNGETADSSRHSRRANGDARIKALPFEIDLRVHDDVALEEIELYTDVLGALAEDEPVARRRIEELLGPGFYRPGPHGAETSGQP